MKHSILSRLLSFALALVMVFTMFPASAFAAESATYTKVEISDAADITAGTYLIYGTSSQKLDDGITDSAFMSTEGSTTTRLKSSALTITDGSVTTDDAYSVWNLIEADGGFYVQNAGTGTYLYYGSNSGNNIYQTEDVASAGIWTVVANGDSWTLQEVASGRQLSCNRFGSAGSYYLGFSSYATSSSTKRILEFYKRSDGTTDPVEPTPTETTAPQETTEPVESTPTVTPASVEDGTYVIWEATSGKAATALAESYSYGYLQPTDVALTDGVLTGYGETNIFTITNISDGQFTIRDSYGRYLYMAGTYNSFNVTTEPSSGHLWIAVANDDGTYAISNVDMGKTLSYDTAYSSYGAYAEITETRLSSLTLTAADPDNIPVDPTEPTDKTVPVMTAAPADGDTVIIYNPANTAAMGSAASGSKLSGVISPSADGLLPLSDDMAQLLVTIDSDGSYIFTLDGKYLTSGATGNSLSFADELTDLGKWTLERQTDGTWYIHNVGANYNGNYNQNLEYYNGFTTYGVKDDNAAYKFEFYLVSQARHNGIVTDLTTLQDGDTVVIFNPANLKALSTGYTGHYNLGTDVTINDGVLSGYTAADLWTLGINADGTYTFSTSDGKKLSMGASYTSTPLDDVNTAWEIISASTADCVYIKNAVRGAYLEWYSDKGNWSSYYNITNESLFAQQIYLIVDVAEEEPSSPLPADGDKVVIYNLAAEGVLAAENDTRSINNALTAIEEGVAYPANGGVIFTVEQNGNYFRFHNETYGYLCSNGTGNNAFYSLEASEDADWTLTEGKSGGFNLESRTAKYNGQYSQYLEYYADSYKTYSMYNVTDYDIYEFFFYPVSEHVTVTEGIINIPAVVFDPLPDAYVGVDCTFSFTVDAPFGVESLTCVYQGQTHTPAADGSYRYVIPGDSLEGLTEVVITVEGVDTKGVAFSAIAVIKVIDEPSIADITPAANTQTGENKRPIISAVIANEGENPTVTMTVNGEAVDAVYTPEHTDIDGLNATYYPSTVTYTPTSDLPDGRTSVTVTVTRADGKTVTKTWAFMVGEATYQLYFGQLHSHTTYSDGSGSLETALDYIASLPDSANVDFVAFTDHSNYFDASGAANPEGALYDMSLATADSQKLWSAYVGAMREFNASQTDVIAVPGFEMTWSGGPGHINTFNTPGIVSRNNTTLNNKTSDAGMKAYYALLSQAEGAQSINQFNHPGSTFGTFTDFAYWDALIDTRIQLVEVGNGEGQIGAGGYYPSYEYYTMALDKGWHVAPTNNQDNHKGKWGNANDARDVILTDDFSEEGIYEAIRAMRMYATEDKNLEITYTANGVMLGSTIEEVPEKLTIDVTVYDPDASDSISRVEVIVNSGKVAHVWDNPAQLAEGALTVTLEPDYSYYYIRVTQGDGDLAVTAPVWVGETLKLGISAVETATSTPVTGEELTITTTLFNSETTDATVKSLVYTVGSEVIGTDTTGYTIPASGTASVDFAYTPDTAKVMKVTVTAIVELDDVEYTFTMDLQLDVQDADKLVYIGIDASHYNEYVNGNYKDSMGNFSNLAAGYSVRTVQLNSSQELIAACSNEKYVALILTAPSRRNGSALRDPYATYSDEEIAALKAFNAAGGALILTGWGDYYESYTDFPAEDHMAAQQNKILEAIGSSIRIADDETKDNTHNGGQSQRLYLSVYDFDNFLLDGVEYDAENPHDNMYTELYSQYGGASIYVVDGEGAPTATVPATVTPAVYGFDTTYSADDDGDSFGGLGETQKYTVGDTEHLMVLATEELPGQGLIVVAGAAFLSNFEVQATIEDSGAEKNYSNYKICENLLTYLNPAEITDIAEVSAQTEVGVKYTIEGVVTSNASGYDKDTAFFDCIYVQDATGGICCFPVAGNYKIGDLVRVTGTTEFYQGEPELQVTSIEVIGEGTVEPTAVTAAQINDRSVEGMLITLSGTVASFELANGLVQTIMVRDEAGDVARVFIDGYITTDEDVKDLEEGCLITVTGLASYDDTFNAPEGPFPRIRIRDRADVLCTAAPEEPEDPTDPSEPEDPTEPSEPEKPEKPFPFTDVPAWAHTAVNYLFQNGIVAGMSETLYGSNANLTRGQAVMMIWRSAGSPEAKADNPFSDVKAGSYYEEAIAWAAENEIVAGVGENKFAPNDAITREQLVVILRKVAVYEGRDIDQSASIASFKDAGRVSSWAREAMEWAVANGMISGYSDGTLAPKGNATRAEFAQILYKFIIAED